MAKVHTVRTPASTPEHPIPLPTPTPTPGPEPTNPVKTEPLPPSQPEQPTTAPEK